MENKRRPDSRPEPKQPKEQESPREKSGRPSKRDRIVEGETKVQTNERPDTERP